MAWSGQLRLLRCLLFFVLGAVAPTHAVQERHRLGANLRAVHGASRADYGLPDFIKTGCMCIGLRPRVVAGGDSCTNESHHTKWCYVANNTCPDQRPSELLPGWVWSEEACEEDASLTDPLCSSASKYVILANGTSCPITCPFTQKLPEDPCGVLCVRGQDCAQVTPFRRYADPSTKECVAPCPGKKVPGCLACEGPRCLQCREEFRLDIETGTCVFRANDQFLYIYAFLGVALLLIIWYFINLCRRPAINTLSRALALRHRKLCRPLEVGYDESSWHPYSFFTDLRTNNIGGIGTALYFRWLCWAVCTCALLAGIACLAFELTDLAHHTDKNYCRHGALNAKDALRHAKKAIRLEMLLGMFGIRTPGGPTPSDSSMLENLYKEHHESRVWGSLVAYVSTLLLTFFMMARQLKIMEGHDNNTSHHKDYALWVHGLPPDLLCPGALQEHFEKHLTGPDAVIGVSLGYEVDGEEEMLETAMDCWLEELEEERHVSFGRAQSPSESDVDDEACLGQGTSAKPSHVCQWYRCDFLDWILLGSLSDGPEPAKPTKSELTEWVRKLPCSGDALVVMVSQSARERVLEKMRTASEPPAWATFEYNDRRYMLAFGEVLNEPTGILWDNLHQNHSLRSLVLYVAKGTALMLSAIFAYALLVFVYVWYYRSLIQVPGVSPDTSQDFLIGLLAAIGGAAIVEPTVNYVADRARFRRKDMRDAVRMVLLFLGNFVSLVLDLAVAVILAEQIMLENAFQDKVEGPDHVLVESIFSIVFPGYLFVSPFTGLLFSFILPYFWGSLLLRGRKVARRDAERLMQPPDMDAISRYSEVLCNFTLVLSLGFAASDSYWKLLGMMVAYGILVISVERVLLLRFAAENHYTTARLSNLFAYLWVVPSAGQAALVAWWFSKAGYLSLWPGLSLVLVHCVVYILVIRAMAMRSKRCRLEHGAKNDVPYGDMEGTLRCQGKPWTFFNTNPIFCLRSWLLSEAESGWDHIGRSHARLDEGSGCVPYVLGKSYLQPGTPEKIVGLT